jgi:hypothetical protein
MLADESVQISIEEKTAALDAVLASSTFARSAQLRSFLRYICTMEFNGRAAEINEYLIGVDALGRPQDFSAAGDSGVRSRAYELRQKLERYYKVEQPGAPLHIVVPKGSYVPQFVRFAPDAGKRSGWLSLATAFWHRRGPGILLVTAALAAGFALAWLSIGNQPNGLRPDPIVAEAWGPLAVPGADVIVCVGTYLHLVVRPNLPKSAIQYPAFPDLYSQFRAHRPLKAGEPLFMEPAPSSVTFGDVAAANIAAVTLHSFGSTYELLPERVVPLPAIRDRNAVVIGIPQNSTVVSKLLSSAIYSVEFRPDVDELAVVDRRAKPGEKPRFAPEAVIPGKPSVVFGLITVLPSEGSHDNRHRTIIFSGLGSVGSNGAADYFASPGKLRHLRDRFRRSGLDGFPPAYQVVVRCTYSDGLLLSSSYAFHEILKP